MILWFKNIYVLHVAKISLVMDVMVRVEFLDPRYLSKKSITQLVTDLEQFPIPDIEEQDKNTIFDNFKKKSF